MGILCIGLAFFLGRSCARKPVEPVPPVGTPAENTGGGWNEDASVLEEVLKGGVLTVPLEDEPRRTDAAPAEPFGPQATAQVSVGEGARKALLRPAEGRQGSGIATSAFAKGEFQHIVVASLPLPAEGNTYTVWLIRSAPFDFFQAGRLIQRADDARWYALFTAANDRRDYTKVVITLESEQAKALPGDVVLEGVLEREP